MHWKHTWKLAVQNRALYLMILPAFLYIAIFHYWPMYGVQIAFRNFNFADGITGSPWVGLKWFRYFFKSNNFKNVVGNTLILNFYNLLALIRDHTTDDTIVYLLHHTECDDTGHIKAKTSGKMLDNQLTLEGLFSIVLLAETDGKAHWFTTQSDGFTPAKSPMEMFAPKIDNDLKAVDSCIREYYGFNEEAKKNEKA